MMKLFRKKSTVNTGRDLSNLVFNDDNIKIYLLNTL